MIFQQQRTQQSIFENIKCQIDHYIMQRNPQYKKEYLIYNKKLEGKQLELDRFIDDSIIGSEKLYQYQIQLTQLQKVYGEAKHLPLISALSYHHVQPLHINYPKYNPFTLTKQQIKQQIQKETFHLEYLKRLQKIKTQNLSIQEKFSSINKSTDENNKIIQRKSLNRKQYSPQISKNYAIQSIKQPYPNNMISSVKKYPHDLDRSSGVKNFKFYQKQASSYQYDQLQQDSSMLVDRYNKGLKAEQYYKDIQKLDELQQKMKAINSSYGNSFSKKYNINQISNNHPYPYVDYCQQNKIGLQRSAKKSPQKTIQKNLIPIIKQDVQQGVQTVINSAHKNKRDSDFKNQQNVQTSEFLNEKLKKIINIQKKDNHVKQNINNKYDKPTMKEKPSHSQTKISSRTKFSKNKLMNTIDISTLNKSDNSPIKKIRDNSKKLYKNPYLQVVNRKSTNKITKQNKSALISQRNRSFSNNSKHKQNNHQILIPAPLFPQSQRINLPETVSDKLRMICNEKIQKRLKMSTIVFKDSKLRNTKHQVDHLWHKFQNQLKGRKQIKDKINSNPRILRKHKMVVE